MDSFYEQDALAWSERQAALLRRLAAGERLNEPVDWLHVIEEVQDVGLSELRACQNLLQQAMTHLLKMSAWPGSSSAGHWRDETGAFLDDAARRFTPSMRQRLDVAALYAKAVRRARATTDASGPARALAATCPFTVDALLEGDVAGLGAALESASAPVPSPSTVSPDRR